MRKKTARRAGSKSAAKRDSASLKIALRGKDNAPLAIRELTEGLLEAARALKPYADDYRIKNAALYLTMIDENGEPVRINDANELVIYPYRSAADEHLI